MFILHNKNEQTYEDALYAMTDETQYYELKFIAKRHWTEELLCAAMKHSCGKLSEVPEEKRTYSVCAAAVQSLKYGEWNISSIPYGVLTFDFARYIVSLWPKKIDTVLYIFRKGRDDQPYTEEDIRLLEAASCPTEAGLRYLDRMIDKDKALNGRSFEHFCSEECGALSTRKDTIRLMNFALSYLLANWDHTSEFLSD